MNDHELEELLRSTRTSINSEDIQLRILSRLAELDTTRRSDAGKWGWIGIAVTGWVAAGIAVLAPFLPTNNREFNQVVKFQKESVVPARYRSETTPETLTFEIDANEPIRLQKHPWSSTVILLSNTSAHHRKTLPVRGRFNATLP